MSETTQDYSNHVRWHAPFHFVLLPILLLHLIWCVVRVFNTPGLETAEAVLLAIGLAVMATLARTNALRAQDRVIRLEERLRFQRLLPADLAEKAGALPVGFIVALRFASDEQLPELARRAVDHKFAKPGELKRAIKHWQGDYLRV
jgi:hypothetical protein